MGYWNLYFIAKLGLLLTHRIDFHLWANLLFALALCVRPGKAWLRVLRLCLAVPAGIALLYYDSHLPPFGRVLSQLGNLSHFDAAYLAELAGRFIDAKLLLTALALILGFVVVNRWLRVTTFSLIAIFAVPLALALGDGRVGGGISGPGLALGTKPGAMPASGGAAALAAGSPEQALIAFHAEESTRQVAFPVAAERTGPAFDVIFLHICSLSSDDMKAAKVANPALFGKFDLLFRDFSSAASYSGPAAIRVLRASCGQPTHQALYSPAPEQCYILRDLQQAGFSPQVVMNHDGHFDNFAQYVHDNIGVSGVQPQTFSGVPVAMRAFDDSPLLDDYQTLAHWYAARLASKEPAVALYYNTISMHDGNHLPNNNAASLETYPLRLRKLLDDIDRFSALIAQSGRRAVLIFVPEHGAALLGDDDQVAGLREIPTYSITHVPVGVKFIGLNGKSGSGPLTVDKPVSYLALAQLLADAARQNPFAGPVNLAGRIAGLPETAHVAENEGTVVMRRADGDFMRTPDGVWIQQGRK
jgi:cellulose synthase operon protein YhjU